MFYNGSNGSVYSSLSLSGSISDQQDGFGTLSFAVSGIQNGSPDGVALSNATGELVQFLSYEGVLTGVGGGSLHEPPFAPALRDAQRHRRATAVAHLIRGEGASSSLAATLTVRIGPTRR